MICLWFGQFAKDIFIFLCAATTTRYKKKLKIKLPDEISHKKMFIAQFIGQTTPQKKTTENCKEVHV